MNERCPNVQRCVVCDRLLIHKGCRSMFESSSYLGQIVSNLLPRNFTWIDIDGALYRRSIQLLRFFEHKSPGQHRKEAQLRLLELLAKIIAHLKVCAVAQREFRLHPASDCFLIEGDPHEGNQLGPSVVTRLSDGMTHTFEEELKLLCWLAQHTGHDREFIEDKLRRRRIVTRESLLL